MRCVACRQGGKSYCPVAAVTATIASGQCPWSRVRRKVCIVMLPPQCHCHRHLAQAERCLAQMAWRHHPHFRWSMSASIYRHLQRARRQKSNHIHTLRSEFIHPKTVVKSPSCHCLDIQQKSKSIVCTPLVLEACLFQADKNPLAISVMSVSL